MSQFIESLHLKDGKINNISFHRERMSRTFQRWFPGIPPPDIETELIRLNLPEKGRFRLSLYYSERIESHKLIEYIPKKISSLKIIEAPDLDYSFKFADRSYFDRQKQLLVSTEDVLYTQNDFITDSSYANLVFCDDSGWFTPFSFLLQGTKRASLLAKGEIREAEIRRQDIRKFRCCSLINAMLDPGEVIVSTSSIY